MKKVCNLSKCLGSGSLCIVWLINVNIMTVIALFGRPSNVGSINSLFNRTARVIMAIVSGRFSVCLTRVGLWRGAFLVMTFFVLIYFGGFDLKAYKLRFFKRWQAADIAIRSECIVYIFSCLLVRINASGIMILPLT